MRKIWEKNDFIIEFDDFEEASKKVPSRYKQYIKQNNNKYFISARDILKNSNAKDLILFLRKVLNADIKYIGKLDKVETTSNLIIVDDFVFEKENKR